MPKGKEIVLGEKSVTGNIESTFNDDVTGLTARLGLSKEQVRINGAFATLEVEKYTLTIYHKPSERSITVLGPKEVADKLYQVGKDPLMQQTLLKVLEHAGYRIPLLG